LASPASAGITPSFREFTQAGGGGAILTSGAGSWTATTGQSWITVTPNTTGVAGAPVVYLVNANPSADPREGSIVIGSQVHDVRQPGYAASISPASSQVDSAGGSVTIDVAPEAIVAWTAQTSDSWITVSSGASGFGTGSVQLSVAAYAEVTSRTGVVTIAGQTHTVTQGGLDLVLEPTSVELESSGTKILIVTVRALGGTSWDPQSLVPWISVIDPGAKAGDSSVILAVSQNQSYLERTGQVRIGSATYTVVQPGEANPSINVSPLSTTASPSGASGSIRVAGTFDAPFRIESLSPWITIAGGADHSIPKDVSFGVAANNLSEARSGKIRVSTPAVAPGIDLVRGLIGHWLGGTDVSGWERHLKDFHQGFTFDGTYEVKIGGRTDLRRPDDSLTLSLLFTPGTSGSKRPLISWHRNDEGCALYVNENDRVVLWRGPLPGTSSTVVTEELVSDYVVAGGGYHHVVLTVDADRTATLRVREGDAAPVVNERLFQVRPFPQDLQANNFRIAYTEGPVNVRLTGSLRDVRLYERVLNRDEIRELDDRVSTGTYNFYSLSAASASVQPNSHARTEYEKQMAITLSYGNRYRSAPPLLGSALNLLARDTYLQSGYSNRWQSRWIEITSSNIRNQHTISPAAPDFNNQGYYYYQSDAVRALPNRQWAIRNEQPNAGWYGREDTPSVLLKHDFLGNGIGHNRTLSLFRVQTYPAETQPFVADRFGQARSALQVGGNLSTKLDRAQSFHTSGHASYALWFKVDAGFNSGTIYNVFDRGNFRVRIEPATPSSTLHLYHVAIPITLEQGNWHHLLLACKTNHVTTVFLDGAEIGSTPLLTGRNFGKDSTERELEIGGWEGVLDDFRVYDEVLTAAEAKAIYEAEKPGGIVVEVSQGAYAGSLNPNQLIFTAAGGTAQTTLTLPGNTAWAFSSTEDWVTKTGGSSGSGSGSLTLQAEPNPSVYERSTTVNVGNAELKVTQAGRQVSLDKRSGAFGTDGGSGTIQVSAEAAAAWVAESPVDWITVATGASGNGSGAVFYVVSPFVGGAPARAAKLKVGGIEHVVMQSGYTVSISPTAETISGNGGKGIVEVSASIEAVWEALALEPWITILGVQSGIGNGRLEYVLSPNKTGATRSGAIVIGGQTLAVTQTPDAQAESEAQAQLAVAVTEAAQLRTAHEATKAELATANAQASQRVTEGRAEVIAAPTSFGLVSEADANATAAQALASGKQEVLADPANFNLVTKASYDSKAQEVTEASQLASGNLQTGRDEVVASPANFGLVTAADANATAAQALAAGKQEVITDPLTFDLVSKASYDQAQASLVSANAEASLKLLLGRNEVLASPSNFGLIFESEANASVRVASQKAMEEGKQEVLANPATFKLVTKASYDQAQADLASVQTQASQNLQQGRNEVVASPDQYGLAKLEVLQATGAKPYTNGWYYQPAWGWIWTSEKAFPYFYRSALGGKPASWLYYREGTSKPMRFFNYAEEKWETLGE
jgi:hypothetical protein